MAKKKYKDPMGYLFVGPLLIGLGIGMIFLQPGPGVLIGLGVSFLALFIYTLVKKK